MNKYKNMIQIWNQHKTPETDLKEMEISDLPDIECKIMVIKMITKVWKTMCEQSENFHK